MNGSRRGIGFVVPYDFALDDELWRWAPPGVRLHITRSPRHHLPVGIEQADAVGNPAVVAEATSSLMEVGPEVVAYGCTAGSFVNGRAGEQAIRMAMMAAGAPNPVTTSGALLEALDYLNITRLAVLTPYLDSVGDRLAAFLAEDDRKVVSQVNLGLTSKIWTVEEEEVADILTTFDRCGAEAIFVSCTNLPSYGVLADAEDIVDVPILSANQVTMWAACRRLDVAAIGERQRLLTATAPYQVIPMPSDDPLAAIADTLLESDTG